MSSFILLVAWRLLLVASTWGWILFFNQGLCYIGGPLILALWPFRIVNCNQYYSGLYPTANNTWSQIHQQSTLNRFAHSAYANGSGISSGHVTFLMYHDQKLIRDSYYKGSYLRSLVNYILYYPIAEVKNYFLYLAIILFKTFAGIYSRPADKTSPIIGYISSTLSGSLCICSPIIFTYSFSSSFLFITTLYHKIPELSR